MKETVLAIAFTAIATGIFKMLCPQSEYKKQIGFLIAAFFLLSCLSLIKNGVPDLSQISDSLKQQGSYVDFSDKSNQMTKAEIEKRIEEELNNTLIENKIFCEEIRVIIDISSVYSISIKQVRLAFAADKAESAAAAEAIVKKEVGDETDIVTEIQGN